MDISVIVVTYNQEETIGRTLDSILQQQTTAQFEIVIGDDCSTDGTEAVCRDYAARYPDIIRYFRREQNMGVLFNYFDCIRRCRGRYLADCAGDDFWVDPCKLQRQFEVLRSQPEVTMVASDWLCRDSDTDQLSRAGNECEPGQYEPGKLLCSLVTNEKVLHLCSALYRKDLIDKMIAEHPEIMTDPTFPAEDLQIELACAAAGKIVVLPEITLHYSVGHESVSHRKRFYDMYRYMSRNVAYSMKLMRFFMPEPSASEKIALRNFFKEKGDYLAAMAFKSGYAFDFSKKRVTAPFKEPTKLPMGFKGKLYGMLMNSRVLWKMAMRLIRHDRKS